MAVTMNLRIRPYEKGEETALWEIFHSSIHQLAHRHYSAGQLAAWAPDNRDEHQWQRRIAANAPFVAVVDGRIAGYADLQPSGYIDHFFVGGACAGRGVGAALMRHLLAVAESRRIGRLYADVSLAAEAFFLRHGFSVETRQRVTIRGVQLQNARMSRSVALEHTPVPPG